MKKRNVKRLTTIAMAAVMMGSVGVPSITMPVTALAEEKSNEEKTTADGFVYKLTSEYKDTEKKEGVSIVAYTGNKTNVAIPTTISDSGTTYDVIKVELNDFGQITDLHIPASITTINIGDSQSLKTVSIENGEEPLTDVSIWGCPSLTSISFPTRIIKEIHLKSDNSLTHITLPEGLTEISENAFYNCTSLKSIKLPSSVQKIDYAAFENCTSLKSIQLSSSIEKIADEAFAGCKSLEEISIPRIERIESYTFYECENLKKVYIPKSVAVIETGAFQYCYNLDKDKGGKIYYEGSKDDWNKIRIDQENDMINKTSVVYNNDLADSAIDISDGKVTFTPNEVEYDEWNGEYSLPDYTITLKDGTVIPSTETNLYSDADIKENADTETATVIITGKGKYKGSITTIIPYKNKITILNKKIDQLEKQINELKSSGSSGGSSADSGKTQEQISSLNKQVTDLQDQVKQLQGKNTDLQNQVDKLQKQVDALKQSASTSTITQDTYAANLVKLDRMENVIAKAKKGKKVTVSWDKSNVNTLDGYRVYYSPKKTSGYKKLVTTKKLKATKKINAASGKKIYIRVRGYKKINGKTVWTKYSDIANVRLHK